MGDPGSLGDETHYCHRSAKSQQQDREHPRRGAGAEREAVHALQIAAGPQREQCNRAQHNAADEILRALDPTRHDGFASAVAWRVAHRTPHLFGSLSEPRLFAILRVWCPASSTLPNDFRQIRPAKPMIPPARNIQSGLRRVAKASAAATAVMRLATMLRSVVCAKINALAPIRPIDNGTSAAWMMAGQRAARLRARKPLT